MVKFNKKFSKEIILLGDIVNYSLKGLIAALGKGVGITKSLCPISFHISEDDTLDDFVNAIISTNLLKEGGVVCIPSKVIAILEKRFVDGLTIANYNRCVVDFNFAKRNLKMADKDPFTKRDQIGLDKIDPTRKLGVRYSKDPNLSAYKIAKAIKNKTGIKIDVVISDSDAGGRKGIKLIGCPTIIATPIGATKGLRLFYCMRIAVAAEMTWNNIENIPVVLIQPYQASQLRKDIGNLRYKGFLDVQQEDDIKFVFKLIR